MRGAEAAQREFPCAVRSGRSGRPRHSPLWQLLRRLPAADWNQAIGRLSRRQTSLLSSLLGSATGRDGGRGFQGGVTAGMRRPLGKFYQVLRVRWCLWGGGWRVGGWRVGVVNRCQSAAGPAGCYFSAAAFLAAFFFHAVFLLRPPVCLRYCGPVKPPPPSPPSTWGSPPTPGWWWWWGLPS